MQEHIGEVHGNPSPDLDVYIRARRLLFNPPELDRLGFPRLIVPPSAPNFHDHQVLVRHYLTSPDIFRRGMRPVAIEISEGEVMFLQEAQRWLRQILARMEVTIECNPSSNLLIGHLGAMDQHPVRTLTLGPMGEAQSPPLMVSINTDDPITFATCLADEYAHLYLSLLRQGMSAERALSWVDRVRQAGWRSRFTLRASTDTQWLEVAARRWKSPPTSISNNIQSSLVDDWDDDEVLPPPHPPSEPEPPLPLSILIPSGSIYPWSLGANRFGLLPLGFWNS